MIGSMPLRCVLALLIFTAWATAQPKVAPSLLIQEANARVTELNQEADRILNVNLEQAQRQDRAAVDHRTSSPSKAPKGTIFDGMETVTQQIYEAVDNFVRRAGIREQRTLQMALTEVLRGAAREPPLVFTNPENTACHISIAFAIPRKTAMMMGPGSTAFTLRCYRNAHGELVLVDAVGRDMDGYSSVQLFQFPQPPEDEDWFLATGRLSGANGPNTRSRIYRLKDGAFQTVWAPANIWADLQFTVTETGFAFTGPLYRENATLRETYSISSQGVTAYLLREE